MVPKLVANPISKVPVRALSLCSIIGIVASCLLDHRLMSSIIRTTEQLSNFLFMIHSPYFQHFVVIFPNFQLNILRQSLSKWVIIENFRTLCCQASLHCQHLGVFSLVFFGSEFMILKEKARTVRSLNSCSLLLLCGISVHSTCEFEVTLVLNMKPVLHVCSITYLPSGKRI